MSLFGNGADGFRIYNFRLDFDGDVGNACIAGKLWAKLMIDDMEREIDVYGPRPSLKDSLIAVSLASGIRCRYTAYIADYINVLTGLDTPAEPLALPVSMNCIMGNYPNPFNPVTSIELNIRTRGSVDAPLRLLIYDMLGRLVRVIDLTLLPTGMHVVEFDGRDMLGRALPSGSYVAVLSGAGGYSTHRMILMK
jgi:hypothetical protein